MIWGEDSRKIGLLSALYAQFPGIEVHEVEDYTKNVHYDPKTMKVWAAENEKARIGQWPWYYANLILKHKHLE